MKELMTYETKKIEGYELDYMQEYQLCHLLNGFSKIATINAEKIGYYDETMRGKYGWVVAKQTLHLKRPITIYDELELSTIIGKNSFVAYPRYYFAHSKGQEVANCSSIWTMIDMESRKITSPKKIGLKNIEVNHDFFLPVPHSITIDIEMEYVCQRQVLYSDIDTNVHMNNTRYLQWAFDLIDFEIHKTSYLSDVTIQYKKEIRPLETVHLYLARQNLRFLIEGRSQTSEAYFTIEMLFKNR